MKPLYGIAVAIAAAVAGPALASGGIGCETDDKNLTLSIETGVTRGMGGPVFNFKAEAEVKSKDVADDLRKTQFEQKHLPQYWLDGDDMRMVLYREREGDKPHGYVEITVLTKSVEEGTYEGKYELSVFDVPASGDQKEFKATGTISCFVE